ncbi:hypothetical protein SH580_03145 [Coraliomargarita algicola]|uniref:Alpha-L-rhamnosidase six-hairpin glycosidase domain-containing protein n=1 Tax=Coraliomargarita algicola TaxID=3092156 RepID=A0ABZ0RNA0_9BACT|nr:hypothetical protein [Coraliomargarita sp. J2-16]WPJ96699.1 hypothetical protein SH580_03145 [Coraliomargarita sp. J2-16]
MITKFNDGVPESESSFGLVLNHYASGRVWASVASHGGLAELSFQGEQDIYRGAFFRASNIAAFDKLARVQVIIDEGIYYLEFNQTKHLPFGYVSECQLGDVCLQHELVLDQGCLFQRVRVLENPQDRTVRARQLLHGHLAVQMDGRQISPWEIGSDAWLRRSVVDVVNDASAETSIIMGADQPLKTYALHYDFMYCQECTQHADEIVFFVAFNCEPQPKHYASRIDQALRNYERIMKNGVCFDTGNPILDSALNNSVPTVMSLVVEGCPGAIRASEHYWVWGWDSMVHAEALLWSGQTDVVREMLDFYRETADPERGIIHGFDSQFKLLLPMAPSAQCLYVVMLYNYFAATGDQQTLDRHLSFAREIVTQAGEACSQHNSLSAGIGFFPDYPKLLEQTKDDISLINNSLYLQALRALQALCGDYQDQCDRVCADLEEVLWDDVQGYWLDSVAESDLSPRHYYPLFGQLYVSPFGTEPRSDSVARIGRFMREHFRFARGLYMYPPTMPGFMADGNQFGAYYPAVDRYYWNIMNQCQESDAADEFESIVSSYWNEHTYPEGLTHNTLNADPTSDSPGCKQAFTAKAWFCDAIELNLGLRVFTDGFSLNPLLSPKCFQLNNLVLRGKRIDIERTSGTEETEIRLNGDLIKGDKITWGELQVENTIRIRVHVP